MNSRVFQKVRLPSLVLAAVLQTMPMVRAALPAMQSATNILAIIFRWGAAAAAALGGVQAVSGASTVITSGNLTATNGVASTNRLTTAPQTAGWWSASGTPPGISLTGSGSNWKLTGIPTTVGVYSVALVAKSSATAPASETTSKTITFTIVAGGGGPPANSPPVANAQSVTTAEDTAKAITLTATDADGNPLTYAIVASPSHGTLSGSPPNVTYTPAANYNGSDSFTFKANDGTVDSATATVSITVTPVNDAPVASAQSVTTAEDTAKAVTLTATDVDANPLTYAIVAAPAHGTLSGTAPNVTYTPAANYNGSDSFTFKANDGTVDSATTTVSITITAVNDVPIASAQSVTTTQNTAKAITLTGSDVDGNALTYAVVASPAHGTLSGAAPNLTYTPTTGYSGSDSFTFKANDGTVDSAVATVSITITAVNTPPVANAQSVTTAEDTAKAVTLTATDADANPLTYAIVAAPAHGTLSGTAPNVTYAPAANYNGSDSFTFRANDGTVNSATATVSITVTPVNDAPVANAQSVTTTKNTAQAVTLAGSDVDGNALAFTVTTPPTKGTLSGTAPNLTYTPNNNVTGADSFTFVANDGTVNSTAATVSITVAAGSNTAPVASAQSVTTAEDTAKAITLAGTDANGDPLTYAIVAAPAHGTLTGTAPNVTYTPAANYNGSDSFTFKVNDGTVDSAVATVSLTITAVNDAPAASAQSVTTSEDTAKAITLFATDVDGNALTYALVAAPAHGTLSGTAPNVTYTPTASYAGADSFTFKANDGTVDSAAATVSITVTAVNHPPVANAQSVTTAEDTAKAITLTASDDLGNPLTFTVTTPPAHGTLSGSGANLTYTPAANYNGADSLWFKANDGTFDSTLAVVSITVTPINDAPVASAQSVATAEDTAKTLTLTGSDVDGDALAYSITTQPAHGILSGTAPNLTYTPTTGYSGSDSFWFKANDGTADSALAVVSITVNAVNNPPTLNALANATLNQNAGLQTIALTGISAGPNETQPLTITAASSNPALIPTPTVIYTSPASVGTLNFTPVNNATGTAILTVTVNDGQSQNNTFSRTFTVTVNSGTGTPTVALTSPASGTSINTPATINLAASVTANGHTITKVQFYADGNLIGEDTTTPYTCAWATEATGTSSVLARAVYDGASSVDSTPVSLTLNSLPVAWTTADIGPVTVPATTTVAGSAYTLGGAGDFCGTDDSFHFVYQSLGADGDIQAQISSLGDTGSSARMGIMIRESLASGSAYAFLGISPDKLFRWQTRASAGTAVQSKMNPGGIAPTWVRLVRVGNVITGYRSSNGLRWFPVGTVNVPMAANIYVGLAVASGNPDAACTATFTSPTVTP